jgi:hypothetical protein
MHEKTAKFSREPTPSICVRQSPETFDLSTLPGSIRFSILGNWVWKAIYFAPISTCILHWIPIIWRFVLIIRPERACRRHLFEQTQQWWKHAEPNRVCGAEFVASERSMCFATVVFILRICRHKWLLAFETHWQVWRYTTQYTILRHLLLL